MGLNTDVTSVLRDVVQFLECLRDVKLPTSLETVRDNLLIRTKDTLTMFVVERIGRAGSPEPYLNMNAAGSKGLMLATLKNEAESQEYVGAEDRNHETPKSQQDYYETFQTMETTNLVGTNHGTTETKKNNLDANIGNDSLVDVYSNFTVAQTKSKCHLCGTLYRKEGKKLFVFEQYRACWVGLVGLHLLIYGTDRDSRPCTILSIRGYMARPAPNAVLRDQRRSESTFEIFQPGSRTFQFVAKTPEDMEEWVTKICSLNAEESKENLKGSINEEGNKMNIREDIDRKEERYQDVGVLNVEKPSEEHSAVNVNGDSFTETDTSFSENPNNSSSCLSTFSPPASSDPVHSTFVSQPPRPPPPFVPTLPARVPRKLPSLPVRSSCYEFAEEEEDDIYHKIEDFRDGAHYGNILSATQSKLDDDPPSKENIRDETYDDVRAKLKGESKNEEKRRKNETNGVAKKSRDSQGEETYDDVSNSIVQDNKENDQHKFESYDDVESLMQSAKSVKHKSSDKTVDELVKSPQKKSFLDRVRSRRESPKKSEKKAKVKASQTQSVQPVINQEPATHYDDVSDLMINVQHESNRHSTEEQSEYTCPPPPRPIYVKPPTIVDTIDTQEFYDDVVAYRDMAINDTEAGKLVQQTKSTLSVQDTVRKEPDLSIGRKNMESQQRTTTEEDEHYKTPRVESGYPKSIHADQPEEDLYDDIAILADFTAKQKEILAKKDSEVSTRLQGSPEKKPWNLFVSGRKQRTTDVSETNSRHQNGVVEDSSDELMEPHSSLRMNTFQKLVSRMENSLGKGSGRTASSITINKNNAGTNI